MQKPMTPIARRPLRRDQLVDGAAHVPGRPVDLHRHHRLGRLVGLGHRHAVVEVRRQCDEPGGGEAVADVADVVDQSPPLLDHDDPGPPPPSGVAR